jgi:hypothetical protein
MIGALTDGDATGGATLIGKPTEGCDEVAYEFLSPEWLAAIRTLREEHPEAGSAIPISIRMNLLVTEVPSRSDVVAHVDTTRGPLVVEEGHLEEADLHVTIDFITARALLVEGNPQAAMSAFMAGKIRVDGDLAKLMAIQGAAPDDEAITFAVKVRDLTA